LLNRRVTYFHYKHLEKSLENYEKILEMQSDNIEVLIYHRSHFLLEHIEDLAFEYVEESLNYLNKALKINLNHINAL